MDYYGDYFLWGGFIFSLIWHASIWWHSNSDVPPTPADSQMSKAERKLVSDISTVRHRIEGIDFYLSGLAVCCFGYVLFKDWPI